MSSVQKTDLELLYKAFKLDNVPIFQNMQQISIRKLFKILTTIELTDLPTIEAMNFYLYCNFFRNRLLYSEIFNHNLNYINLKSIELKQHIKNHLHKYDQMLKEAKSESDCTWIDNNIVILHDGLTALDSIPDRCDYYDNKVIKYLDPDFAKLNSTYLSNIQDECSKDFTHLSKLFLEVGRIIGR